MLEYMLSNLYRTENCYWIDIILDFCGILQVIYSLFSFKEKIFCSEINHHSVINIPRKNVIIYILQSEKMTLLKLVFFFANK